MPVHQQRAVSRTFAYLGWTLGVTAAVAAALVLDAAHEVTKDWFVASLVASLGSLLAIVLGREEFRLRTLRVLLTCFAVSDRRRRPRVHDDGAMGARHRP
jgi:ABC-type Fe3+-siderophore transport system permease subunit